MKSVLNWLDRQQQRHEWAALPFGVFKKFTDDEAGQSAALISYWAFFSIMPLMLVFATVLGYVLEGNEQLQDDIINSALAKIPIFGPQLRTQVHEISGDYRAVIIGTALALWTGLAVAKQLQRAFNRVYCVPRKERPNFIFSALRALGIVAFIGLGLIATSVATTIVTGAGSLGIDLGTNLRFVSLAVSIAINTALFTLLFSWLTVRKVRYRHTLPGGILAAVAFQVLQLIGTALVAHKLKGAQATYGTFATVIGLLSWFYLQSQVTMIAAELNVVLQFHLWPRSINDDPITELPDDELNEGGEAKPKDDAQPSEETTPAASTAPT